MDTPKTITHIGLCAGYGGIELGLHRVIRNLRSVALCEIEAFACANLVAKMEAGLLDCAPIWTNLKSFPWAEFRDRVDILTGGYPCQPFSAAGKRLGTEDPRHLWPFIADGIRVLRPKLCFFENVEGHISLGLSTVISDLEELGYKVSWGIFSASEVGAPHQRKRVFILAHSQCTGLERWGCWMQSTSNRSRTSDHFGAGCDLLERWPSRPGQPQHAWEPPRVVGNSLLHGHASGEITGGTCQGENQRRVQEPAGGSASMGNADPRGLASGIDAGSGAEADRGGQGDIEQADSGSMADASNSRPSRAGRKPQSGGTVIVTGDRVAEALGNPNSPRPQERQGQRGAGIQGTNADGGEGADRQTQPALGRDADGPAGGLDDAELCVSCDNRTDELRLLGNGVVPATAARAFRVLWHELINQ